MTSTGTGVGGNVGGPSIPLQRDLEATAWTEVNKAALGIVHDSIEKAFIELNPRYTFGYLGGFGYRTSAENPLLNHPLETQRRSESSGQSNTRSWQDTYDGIINQLPPELLARFTSEGQKPFEQRSLSFVALDNLLQTTAKIVTQADNLAQPAALESLNDTRTALNLLLPFAALKGALSNTNETIQASQSFLAGQGANYPYFDGMNSLLNNLQNPMNLLQRVNSSLGNTVNGQLSPAAITAAAKASQQLGVIRSQLEKIDPGPDLQLLLSIVRSLETVSTALALPTTATAPLFIAFSLAAMGSLTAASPAGLMGPSLQTVVEQLNKGLIAGLMPSNNKAGNTLFSLMTTMGLAAFVSLASLALNPGLGILPIRNSKDVDKAHSFAFEIALQLAVSSGFIETFYKEAIAISGGSPKAQDLGSSSLAQVAHLMIILSGSIGGKSNAEQLIEEEAYYLNKGIVSAAEIEKNIESENTVSTSIALKLSSLALESKDFQAFLEANQALLEGLGTSMNALMDDISQLNSAAGSIVNVLGMGNPDEQLTRIVNIV